MGKRRASQAPLGVTSNGVVLVNVVGLLDPDKLAKLRACLPRELGDDWFLGIAIVGDDIDHVLGRLDDAAAEAAASLAGRGLGQTPSVPRASKRAPRSERAERAPKRARSKR